MKPKRLSVVLLILSLILVALLPAALQLFIRGAATQESYSGRLTVWQIAGVAQTNTALKSALADFEREHFSVFLTLTLLTPEEASAKMAAGEYPDLISAQASHLPEREFVPIDVRGLPRPYLPFDGSVLPYAADIYVTAQDDALDYPLPRTLSYTEFRELEDSGDWIITEIGAVTDLIRYICALPSGDPLKDGMSAELCRSLISVKNQRRVIEKGLLPSVLEFETFDPAAELTDDTLARSYSISVSKLSSR